MAYGRRALNRGPWHYCSRCDKKKLIESELQWQRGKLLCEECIDIDGPVQAGPGLIGQREVVIDVVLSDGAEELAPVKKLREPDYQQTDDDIVLNI